MFDDDPLPAADVCTLVALIEKRNGWQTKADIISLVGGRVGGDWFTSTEVADYVDRNHGTCRRALQALEGARVILRDGGDGGRRFWCELNPDWEAWRVPWRFPLKDIRRLLAYAQAQADRPPVARLIARPYGARYPAVIARLGMRDEHLKTSARTELSRVSYARDNGKSTASDRAFERGFGSIRTPVSRAKATRDNSGRGSTTTTDVDQPVVAPGEVLVEGVRLDGQEWRSSRQAVLARCVGRAHKKPFLNGEPARHLAELTARHGSAAVVEAAEQLPAGVEMVPGFVEQLADILDGHQQPTVAAVSPPVDNAAERMRIQAQLEGLDAVIAACRADGWDPPPEKLDERTTLVERLAALGSDTYDQRI